MAYEILVDGGVLVISESSRLVLALKKGNKSPYAIDMRHYVATLKYTGPTKKGVFFPVSSVAEVEKFRGVVNALCDKAVEHIKGAEKK